MSLNLSADQSDAMDKVTAWYINSPVSDFTVSSTGEKITEGYAHDYPVLSIGGYAGTGKTTVLREVGIAWPQTIFCTPTHKAAAVLRSKLPPHMRGRVRTFHSLIYRAMPVYNCENTGLKVEAIDEECNCVSDCECAKNFVPCAGRCPQGCIVSEQLQFERRQYLSGHFGMVVVDEASMLTDSQVADIRFFGVPLLLIGDHGQLPPVKAAMNKKIQSPDLLLTVNHRQGETSGIIQAAEDARRCGSLNQGKYGASTAVVVPSSSTARSLMERYIPDTVNNALIVRYNVTRANLNKMYHYRYGDALLNPGERIISLQREETVPVLDKTGDVVGETFLFNRTLATVDEVTYTSPGGKVIEVAATLDADWKGATDTKVLLRIATEQLGSPDKLSYRNKPHSASLWDYAYAITAHVAQGSEYDNVVVWHEGGADKRWLYTAVTRAKNGLVVLQ